MSHDFYAGRLSSKKSDVAQSLGSIPNNLHRRSRPSIRSIALSLQSIESDLPSPEAYVQEQISLDMIASEADLAIEEQFEDICNNSSTIDPTMKNKVKSDFNLPIKKIIDIEQTLSERARLLSKSSSISKNAKDEENICLTKRTKSLPKRDTTLSTFWKLVDRNGLKPMQHTMYLPDTADLDSLNERLKRGGVDFEDLKGSVIVNQYTLDDSDKTQSTDTDMVGKA